MFKEYLKLPIKITVRNNLLQAPYRMKAAAKLNSKPYVETVILQPMKPPSITTPPRII